MHSSPRGVLWRRPRRYSALSYEVLLSRWVRELYWPTMYIYRKLTYSLTPCNRVLLEKLTGSQLVKKFPEFYGIRMFITALTSARQLSITLASSIQSIPPYPTSRISILILSIHLRLGLPSGLFPSGFSTKTLCTPLLSTIRSTFHAHLILLDLISRYLVSSPRSLSYSLCSFLHSPVSSSLLDPNILLNKLTDEKCFSLISQL